MGSETITVSRKEMKKPIAPVDEKTIRERIRKSLDDLKHGRIKEV